jgi:hypothetical protein
LHCYLFYCIIILLYLHSHLVLDNHSSWGRKTRRLFYRLFDENEESFYDCSLRVRYKPQVPSWGKCTLATTHCTWSPNEVTHYLVSSRC